MTKKALKLRKRTVEEKRPVKSSTWKKRGHLTKQNSTREERKEKYGKAAQERRRKIREESTANMVNTGRLKFESLTKKKFSYKNKASRDKHFFTKDNVEKLISHVEEGNSLEDAAKLVYLDPKMVKEWYDDNYKNFKYGINQAEAFQKSVQVRRVLKGERRWVSSSWYLERKYRFEYNKDLTILPPKEGDEDKQFVQVGEHVIAF